jgi:hypothetical protein
MEATKESVLTDPVLLPQLARSGGGAFHMHVQRKPNEISNHAGPGHGHKDMPPSIFPTGAKGEDYSNGLECQQLVTLP